MKIHIHQVPWASRPSQGASKPGCLHRTRSGEREKNYNFNRNKTQLYDDLLSSYLQELHRSIAITRKMWSCFKKEMIRNYRLYTEGAWSNNLENVTF